ncbi:DUF2750 domain-containing protein [uncultured Shewanella sp.]|uniref:DUF2750 domain-containing protein n=1 Tax=uncultured Shewanella sp. TaxID=173975 RepID=UPI002630406E|nr:DUF2750 domain-containing protein [uncultured Shewanella sp.]
MSTNEKSLKQVTQLTPEARYDFLVKQVKDQQNLWTLQDVNGCVMLTTDEEDCIPMWPSEEAAALWAVDDWKDCQPLAIPLKEWIERWVPGMQDDELYVAVFPVHDDLGVVIPPFELEARLLPKQQH